MGIIRTTTRPSHYVALEAEHSRIKPEVVLKGRLILKIEVDGLRNMAMRIQQKRIERVVSCTLCQQGHYVRQYNHGDDLGYYTWDGVLLHQNMLYTDAVPVDEINRYEGLLDALNAEGWYPRDIVLTYYPDGCNLSTVFNLVNILESRRSLIEQALSLKEPMAIIVNQGLALSITPSVFSYPLIEAAAFLIARSCELALTTGKARMKPCNVSNPKYQMRSWLLRLGFVGEEFERPRRTLLAGLEGDTSFFNEEQKQVATAKRKAKKLNAPQTA